MSAVEPPRNSRVATATYPFLSPTFRSHQLWTPYTLQRITINDPNYHSYLTHSLQTNPTHLNALSKRVKKYGDNGFFLHKDIPIEQIYDRTALKRSEVRPWDQIVSRPIMTPFVLSKESSLPFPSEHPYTSHISQFSVFPNTRKENDDDYQAHHFRELNPLVIGRDLPLSNEEEGSVQNATDSQFKEVSTQTIEIIDTEPKIWQQEGFTKQRCPTSYLIREKACSGGLRKETQVDPVPREQTYLSSTLRPGIYRWDVSRSRSMGLQRSLTYPAPTTMFSPANHGLSFRSLPLNPATLLALESVNNRIATTTTYQRQFPSPPTISRRPASSRLQSLMGSRGKYSRAPVFSLSSENIPSVRPQSVPAATTRKVFSTSETVKKSQLTKTTKDSETFGKVVMIDEATQTDFDWDHSEAELAAVNYEDEIEAAAKSTRFYLSTPTISEDGSYLRPTTADSSATNQTNSSRQSSVLQTPYSRTEALQRFNMMYSDKVPDLRENFTHTGRRHVINGYHAYYWH